MTESNTRFAHVNRYARHFFSGTFLSRVSGMLRDISMAALFGDHPSVAAFMVAFRFSHLLRRILGEGALQSILIPQYKALTLRQDKSASTLFFQLSALLTLGLVGLTVIVEWVTHSSLLGSLASGNHEITSLFSLLFPSLIFITLYGLNTSILQCKDSFFLSSLAPLSCNLVWLLAIFALSTQPTPAAMSYLAAATTLGFAIQWLLTFAPTWGSLKEGWHNWKGSLFSSSLELKTIGKATFLGLFGVTAVQINSFLDMIFARYADPKGPVYLWYAIRLEQLPLALIGFACVYSIIPSLAESIKSGNLSKTKELFSFGKRRIFLLVIPSVCALFSLGLGSVDLLFGRGHFMPHAVLETTYCLIAYTIGLLPSVLTLYYAAILYAHDDYKTPTIASMLSVALNIALNALFILIFHWGAISIALGTSLSALVNAMILRHQLGKHSAWTKEITASPLKTLITCSVTACFACAAFDWIYFNGPFFNTFTQRSFHEQLIYFTAQFLLFTGTYLILLRWINKTLWSELKGIIIPLPNVPVPDSSSLPLEK